MLTAAPQRVSSLWLGGAVSFALVATIAAAAVGGEARQFSLVGAELGPLVLLCALAQLGQRHAWSRLVGWLWFAVILILLALGSVGATIVGIPGFNASPMAADTALTIVTMLGGAVLLLVLSVVALKSGGWVWIGRGLGAAVDAHNLGHAQGVVGTLFWIVVASAPLVVLHGQPPLLTAIAHSDIGPQRSDFEQNLDLLYMLLWVVPVAVVGAGYPLQRDFKATLDRLGIAQLRRSQLAWVFAISLGLVGLGMLVGAATDAVWAWFGWRTTDSELVRRLFGSVVTNPLGILMVGLSAGISEELITRGLFQPRLGWFLPNVAFAAAHAFQYGPDAIVVVFVVGTVQAYVRYRWNTTAAIITHSTYDVVLLLLALLGAPGS